MRVSSTLLLLSGSLVAAQNSFSEIFTSSYEGGIKSYIIPYKAQGIQTNLSIQRTTNECGKKPSWLTYEASSHTLYCNSEDKPGRLVAFDTRDPNKFIKKFEVDSEGTDVHSELVYLSKIQRNLIVVARNGDGGNDDNKDVEGAIWARIRPIAEFSNPFTTKKFGLKSHPAQIVNIDNRFIMAPDRGLDVIHHYRIDQELGWLKDCPHIQLKANVSPRRAKYFKTSKGVAMLYVGTEKTNKIVAYPITNPDQNPNEGCLKWGEPTVIDAFGNGTAKNKPFLGEMRIKHDMLYVSDRNDNSFGAGNDSMSIFSINQDTGIPKFVRRFSVGSQAPKTFSFNAKGDKMVIGAQQSGRFVINSVNTTTGMPGAVANQSVVAPTNGMVGGLTSVLFAE